MTKPWAKSPNAMHINKIIKSVREYPKIWDFYYGYAGEFIGGDTLAETLYKYANSLEDDTPELYEKVDVIVSNLVDNQIHTIVDGFFEAISYLILTPDDCGDTFKSKIKDLKLLARLGNERAIVLLPTCMAFKAIKALT